MDRVVADYERTGRGGLAHTDAVVGGTVYKWELICEIEEKQEKKRESENRKEKDEKGRREKENQKRRIEKDRAQENEHDRRIENDGP